MSGVVVVAVANSVVVLVLGLVALIRARAVDIPAVVRAIGSWFKR